MDTKHCMCTVFRNPHRFHTSRQVGRFSTNNLQHSSIFFTRMFGVSNEGISLSRFLMAVNQLQFRGTSYLFRLPKPPVVRRASDPVLPANVGQNEKRPHEGEEKKSGENKTDAKDAGSESAGEKGGSGEDDGDSGEESGDVEEKEGGNRLNTTGSWDRDDKHNEDDGKEYTYEVVKVSAHIKW